MIKKVSDNKRIARNTGFLLIRMIVMAGITFYSSRILLRELGVSDYGLYGLIGGVVAMFGSLRGVFASSIQRFLNYEMGQNDAEGLNKVFSLGVIIHIILALFFLVIAESIGLWFLNHKLVIDSDRFYAANWVFQFSVFTSIITILTIPYDAVIIANERMKAFAYISLFDAFLKLIVIFCVSFTSNDKLIFYAFLLFLVSIITRIISWFYCIQNFTESKFKLVWDKKLFSSLGGFAGWNFLGNTAQTLSNEGLNIVLNIFGGTIVNAARGIAYQVRSLTMQILNNFLLSVNPHMIKLYSKNNEREFFKMLFFISKISFYVIFVIVIPLFLFSEVLLELWLVTVPPLAVLFVKLILIYLLVRSFHSPIDTLFKAGGQIRNYQIVDAITLFLTLPISYILLNNNYDVHYVFIVMILVEFLNLASILYLAHHAKKLDVKSYLLNVILPCFWVCIICVPISYVIVFALGNLNQIVQLVIIIIINMCGVLLLGFNMKEKKVFFQKINLLKTYFK